MTSRLLFSLLWMCGALACRDERAGPPLRVPRPARAPLGPEALPPLPQYSVARTRTPPVLDGQLEDASWKQAQEVTLTGSFDGRFPTYATRARLLYDDAFLYVAFEVEDPDLWGSYRHRDQPLYEQEVVELFVDAQGEGTNYQEIEVSAHNVLFDASFTGRQEGMNLAYDSQARSAVAVRGTLDHPQDVDSGWSVELKLPFTQLGPEPHKAPQAGDRWRFNLYRLEHVGRRRVEGQAFSPLFVGDFHALPRFAWLVFR